jgi:putative flavoprotein involved in K+ transport
MMEFVETVIVGGGQAGLAMSFWLKQHGREHVILERARVAENWHSQRWDSLMFQFPNWSIGLPGQQYVGRDPDEFSTKDQICAFIDDYRTKIQAPVRTGINVLHLRPATSVGLYSLLTDHGELRARNVVVATGPYQRAEQLPISAAVPAGIEQLHASEYRSPGELPTGAVLIVGSGNSGCQIAEELAQAGRRVFFSIGRHRRVPRRYRDQDVFWWRRAIGDLDRTTGTTSEAERMPAPLVTGVNGGHDVDLRRYADNGTILLGRVLNISGGRAALSDDLEENLRRGDRTFVEFQRTVDKYVSEAGIDAPPPPDSIFDPAPTTALNEPVKEIDLRKASINSIIWSTGYAFDFGWIEIPIIDDRGRPVHQRGATNAPGLYFLGLPWLHKAKSSFLCGVGEDAAYLADQIVGVPEAAS